MLIGENAEKVGAYTFQSVEVKEQAFRFDGIFMPQWDADDIYFVEVQFAKEIDFYARFFNEIFLYLRQYQPKNNWRAVVIFPDKGTDAGIHEHYREFFANQRLIRIYLDQLPPELLEQFPVNLLRIINVANENVSGVVKQVITQISQLPNTKLKETSGELLINLLLDKYGNITREELQKMVEPLMSNIRNSRFFKEVKQEGKEEGIEEGRQEGRQEGREEGIMKTARNMLAKGLDISLIAEVTGLSEQVLQKLKNENGQ